MTAHKNQLGGTEQFMKERIIRPGVVNEIMGLTKRENHSYTYEEVDEILSAFFNVMEAEISKGNSIHFNGYMKIEPKFNKERKARNIILDEEVIIPARYRVSIKPGEKFKNAAAVYTDKALGGKDKK